MYVTVVVDAYLLSLTVAAWQMPLVTSENISCQLIGCSSVGAKLLQNAFLLTFCRHPDMNRDRLSLAYCTDHQVQSVQLTFIVLGFDGL